MDRDEMWQVAQEFIAIQSPTGFEKAAMDYLAERFRGLGLPVKLQEVEADRSNMIATWDGAGGGGKSLVLTGHVDACNTFDPLTVEGDWLFGSGATNMKGC